jgi:hypothetical protein
MQDTRTKNALMGQAGRFNENASKNLVGMRGDAIPALFEELGYGASGARCQAHTAERRPPAKTHVREKK